MRNVEYGNVVEYNGDMYLVSKIIHNEDDYLSLVCLKTGVSWDTLLKMYSTPNLGDLEYLFENHPFELWNSVFDVTSLEDVSMGC